MGKLKITDTTFRDAHQSLLATRLRTEDMVPIAAEMGAAGFHSMEVWGGATFDATTRFLAEDPWERLRTFKRLMPNTPLMMLLRGQSLVGYRTYADDVVDAFVDRSAKAGIDVFRVFDALNDEQNLQRAADAIKRSGKHLQIAICYSVTEEGRLGGPIYNLDYFIERARRFQEMGVAMGNQKADFVLLTLEKRIRGQGGAVDEEGYVGWVSTVRRVEDFPKGRCEGE